jgi:hypothetical protein
MLEANRNSSVAHYRIGELLLLEGNLQSAANEFREAMAGNLDPKWTEVWAHIGLSQVFEMSNQRDRAFNELKLARRTGDNSFGAQDEVARLLKEMGVELQPRILVPRARAEAIEKAPADYTDEARIAELEGTVLLDGIIGEDGLAHDLTVLRPLGLGLDDRAIDAVRQWLFTTSQTNGQTASTHEVIAVDFFLSSKQSRWHLVRVDFSLPPGSARPIFLTAEYPVGAGVFGKSAIEEGELLGAIGRQASAKVSFDINEHGSPVNIQPDDASESMWAPEAAILVSDWRFKPGMKDGKPIQVRRSIDLVWGTRNLTATIVERFRNAAANQELDQEIIKAMHDRP